MRPLTYNCSQAAARRNAVWNKSLIAAMQLGLIPFYLLEGRYFIICYSKDFINYVMERKLNYKHTGFPRSLT